MRIVEDISVPQPEKPEPILEIVHGSIAAIPETARLERTFLEAIREDVEMSFVSSSQEASSAAEVVRREAERQVFKNMLSVESNLRIVSNEPEAGVVELPDRPMKENTMHVLAVSAPVTLLPDVSRSEWHAVEQAKPEDDAFMGDFLQQDVDSNDSQGEGTAYPAAVEPLFSVSNGDRVVDINIAYETTEELHYPESAPVDTPLEVVADSESSLFYEGTLDLTDFQPVSSETPGAMSFKELLVDYIDAAVFDTVEQKQNVHLAVEYVLALVEDMQADTLEGLSEIEQREVHAELYDAVERLLLCMKQDTSCESVMLVMNELLNSSYYIDPSVRVIARDLSHERKKPKADHLPHVSLRLLHPAGIPLGKKAVSSSFELLRLVPLRPEASY